MKAFFAAVSMVAGASGAHAHRVPETEQPRLVFIGQDLDALRGYQASRCCAAADGTTAYVDLYDVLSAEENYGGLGVDAQLRPIGNEKGWGAGPVSAWKSAVEFAAPRLAIGLSITEEDQPDGIRKIVAGDFDPQIIHLARLIKKLDRPVFLRVGYEFDGTWNQGYADRQRYVAAWRRIVDIVRHEGAVTAVTVWQASASPIDDMIEGSREDIRDWSPGDAYVDWMGLSWFVGPDERPVVPAKYRPATARMLADEVVALARERRKPVMVAELAPQGYDLARGTNCNVSPVWDGPAGYACRSTDAAGAWSEWFAPFFAYAQANADVVRSIAYIGVDWNTQPMWGPPYRNGYWGDTRLHADAGISRRWNAAVARWQRVAQSSKFKQFRKAKR